MVLHTINLSLSISIYLSLYLSMGFSKAFKISTRVEFVAQQSEAAAEFSRLMKGKGNLARSRASLNSSLYSMSAAAVVHLEFEIFSQSLLDWIVDLGKLRVPADSCREGRGPDRRWTSNAAHSN